MWWGILSHHQSSDHFFRVLQIRVLYQNYIKIMLIFQLWANETSIFKLFKCVHLILAKLSETLPAKWRRKPVPVLGSTKSRIGISTAILQEKSYWDWNPIHWSYNYLMDFDGVLFEYVPWVPDHHCLLWNSGAKASFFVCRIHAATPSTVSNMIEALNLVPLHHLASSPSRLSHLRVVQPVQKWVCLKSSNGLSDGFSQ